MKRRPLSPLLDRSSGHREARLVREAEDRGRLLGRSLFFDGCPAWGSAGLGERGRAGRGPGRAGVAGDVGKGMEQLQWLLEF